MHQQEFLLYTARTMASRFFIIAVLFPATLALSLYAPTAIAQQQAAGVDVMRIENEDKLVVPAEIAEEVWGFLVQTFVENGDTLPLMGSGSITARYAIEDFTDTYFDTPDLHGLHRESGVRLRYRENRTDPDDDKSGRRLMQVKISGIDDNPLNRAEYKYDVIEGITHENLPQDVSPVAIVVPDQREDFADRLAEFGWNGYAMKPIVTLQQERKRVYFSGASGTIMSVSHDTVSAELMGHAAGFIELEPELSEVEYTEATPAVRQEMEAFQQEVVSLIRQEFPAIERDLAPKYNKTFKSFDEQIRWLEWKTKLGIQNFYAALIILIILPVLGIFILIRGLRIKGFM